MIDISEVIEEEFARNESPVDQNRIRQILNANNGARVRTWLGICSRCGLCAESCFVYLSNDRHPKLSPAYKFKHTLGEMYRRKGKLNREFLKKSYEISWLQCTMCKRCSIFCPFGIDIATMIAISRSICHSQGFRPQSLVDFSENCRKSGNHMGIPVEELIDTCEWMEEEYEDDWPGLKIPIDKENADIMYTLNAREPKHYPQDIGEAAILFHVAGENWTVPSEGWEETSLAMFAGDWEACKLQVQTVYAAMERLKPKRMVVTECGNAYRATVIEGPYWAGIKSGQTPVESIHYVEWIAEALREGKLKIDPKKNSF